jgi:hypothetical protein
MPGVADFFERSGLADGAGQSHLSSSLRRTRSPGIATMRLYALKLLGCVVALLTVTSCREATAPTTEPWIRGTITAGPEWTTYPATYLVVAPGGEDSCLDHMRAQVRVADANLFWRTGGKARASDLKAGQPVSVWISGPILDVCPPIVSGTDVVIENAPS